MIKGEKEALLAFLELNLVVLVDAHAMAGHIKKDFVDEVLEDVYNILNDLDETIEETRNRVIK